MHTYTCATNIPFKDISVQKPFKDKILNAKQELKGN